MKIFLLPCTRLLFLPLFLTIAGTSFAQSTNISIGTTAIQPSVKRLGINLGTLDYYDSGQTTQNLMVQNPGFEGQIWNSIIRCMSGTATTCVDDDQWSGWPASYWNGATFQVVYGAAAGRVGTVAYSSAAGSGQGVTLTFSNSGTAPAAGDYVIIRKTVPGGASQGWWPSASGAGAVTDNLTDLPPGTLGKQTVALTAPGASDSATISGFFDSTVGKTFVQLNGTYQLQFKAKGTGGSNSIKVLVGRTGVATYVNHSVALSNSWNTYTVTFTAAENGSAIGGGDVTFSTVGADAFELDDVSLARINGDSTNTTVFRDPVVNALRTLQPGVLRYWGGQLGDTLDNLLTPSFGRQRSGFLAWYNESDTIEYGLHDFLALCQTVGAEPWFVVPTTFSATDASNLIQYLAGSTATPYGYKRQLLGQTAPWTQVFSKIHLEFGNEAWNPTFKGGSIEYAVPYGSIAQTIFGIMRANPAFTASNFDLVLGGQAANASRDAVIQNNCNNNDSFSLAPYTMGDVDSYSDNESLFGSTFAEPEALMSSAGTAEGLNPGMVYQDYQAIQSSSHPVPLSFYETNLSTLSGSITQQALNSFVPSLGAGLMVADTMLLSLRNFGVVNQELFALPQYDFVRTDGKTVLLWGAALDMGVTDRRRPQFLALQLANQALSNGAVMLQTVHSGADPTWNQPLVNTVQLNGAHYLQSFAFSNGGSYSAIVFNLSRSSALPVTFSGTNAPSGTVQMQQLTSANPTDTNENASIVNTATSSLSGFTSGTSLSLPPYSMTVLTWGGASAGISAPVSSSAPVISAVTATAITSTSATITWTTNQAASSETEFGTTTAYGTYSTPNSSLVTSHTASLTGLTAGTTYDYAVVSGNASLQYATSPNYTFSTPALSSPTTPVTSPSGGTTGPQISYISAWGITTTGATVTWSTNEPATTSLSYGLTSALGQTTPIQTALTASHGVTLTGLTSGTTYYFAATSTDANGNVGTSSVQSFTVASAAAGATVYSTPPPQLSYVVSWDITNDSATISWSTNEPSTSALAYGTSSTLGQVTPTQGGLTLSHGVTLNGLSSGTTYYFVAQSADSSGNTGYSSPYTFTTGSSTTNASAASAALVSDDATAVGTNSVLKLSYVASWGLSTSGITVSWSTNAPANTSLAYGTTPALGLLSPVQTSLTASHGVVLTGLASGTTYYFAAKSTDAHGNAGVSATYKFTTVSTVTPTLSGIVVTPQTGHTTQLSWTTSVPTYSYVAYGQTNSYSWWTAQTGPSAHPQAALANVPSGIIHYQLTSTDAYGNKTVSPDYTFTEP